MSLLHDHTPDAIEKRIRAATQHSYAGDGVLGAIDGTVTTFAIVAAASGAGFSDSVGLIFGFANVLADGFSMGVSNYLRAKSNRQVIETARRVEENHIDEIPDGEREEVRQIFAVKGFTGQTLDDIVEVITADRKRWVDTMLTEELGLPLETEEPFRAAEVTSAAFLLAGLVPLLALWGFGSFLASAIATAITFAGIGLVKARVLGGGMLASSIETLLIGGAAAALAYAVAAGTKDLVS